MTIATPSSERAQVAHAPHVMDLPPWLSRDRRRLVRALADHRRGEIAYRDLDDLVDKLTLVTRFFANLKLGVLVPTVRDARVLADALPGELDAAVAEREVACDTGVVVAPYGVPTSSLPLLIIVFVPGLPIDGAPRRLWSTIHERQSVYAMVPSGTPTILDEVRDPFAPVGRRLDQPHWARRPR